MAFLGQTNLEVRHRRAKQYKQIKLSKVGNVHPGLNSLKLGCAEIHTKNVPGKDLSSKVVKNSQGDVFSSTPPLQAGSHEKQGHSACRCTNTVVLKGDFYLQLDNILTMGKNSPFCNQRAQGGLPMMILKGGKVSVCQSLCFP